MAWRWTRLSEGSSTPHTPSSRSRSGFEDAAPRVDRGLRAVLELDLAGALGLVAEVRRRAPLWAGAVGELRQLRADGLRPTEARDHHDLHRPAGRRMRSAPSAYLSKAAQLPWTPPARVLSPMVLTYTLDLRGVGRGRRRRVSQSAPIEVHDLLRSVIVDLHIRIHSRGLRWAIGRGGSHGCTAVTWQ